MVINEEIRASNLAKLKAKKAQDEEYIRSLQEKEEADRHVSD